MTAIFITKLLNLLCEPFTCDLSFCDCDTENLLWSGTDSKCCYRKICRFCLFTGLYRSVCIKGKGQLLASSKTAALLPVISCRPITGDFAAALKIFSASFLLVITLKCFWIFSSSPSAPLIETASKRFKIDLKFHSFPEFKCFWCIQITDQGIFIRKRDRTGNTDSPANSIAHLGHVIMLHQRLLGSWRLDL